MLPSKKLLGSRGPTSDETQAALIAEQIAQLLEQKKKLDSMIELKKQEETANTNSNSKNITLVIVANRLPVSLTKVKPSKTHSTNTTGNGDDDVPVYKFKRSAGGLATALAQLENLNMKWVGCPDFVEKSDRPHVERELNRMGMYPLFVDELTDYDNYYNGFCNGVIWPLFHYIEWADEVVPRYNEFYYAYRKINIQFADLINEITPPGSMVWIHDYHLLLCPSYLRRLRKNCIMGFFLHIPFPNYEQYRLLPTGSNLLQGVLACNLVGFHTHDYAQHFRQTCAHQLKVELHPQSINTNGRMTIVSTFPIGTDPKKWRKGLKKQSVRENILRLTTDHRDKKIVLGVDRLDFIKGIPHKLYAFERFLEKNPEYISQIVFIQIAVPSRQKAPQYIELTRKCNELVGKINAQYSSFASVPIHFLQQSFGFDDLCALYHVADVCFVTSVRDGMNLVSYEYIACQDLDDPGVLVVSEFAGCAQSLASGALVINPWDAEDTANGLKMALEMDVGQRRTAQKLCYSIIRHNTVQHWATGFMDSLELAHKKCPKDAPVVPPRLSVFNVWHGFKQAKQRLLLLSCGGTLIPPRKEHVTFENYTKMTRISKRLKKCLTELSNDENTTVAVISAGPREFLDSLIGDINCIQFAENGYFMRTGGKDEDWTVTTDYTDLSWKDEVLKTMEHFKERIPFTYIDDKMESYVAFRYKANASQSNTKQISELVNVLDSGPLSASYARVVHDSSGHIQVRQPGISKLSACERTLQQRGSFLPIDYILCVGSLLSFDEDVFVAMNKKEQSPGVHSPSPKERASPLAKTKGAGSRNSSSSSLSSQQDDVKYDNPGMTLSASKQNLMSQMYPSTNPQNMMYTSKKSSVYTDLVTPECKVVTVKVGRSPTRAKFYLNTPRTVEDILVTLSEAVFKPESSYEMSPSAKAVKANAVTMKPPKLKAKWSMDSTECDDKPSRAYSPGNLMHVENINFSQAAQTRAMRNVIGFAGGTNTALIGNANWTPAVAGDVPSSTESETGGTGIFTSTKKDGVSDRVMEVANKILSRLAAEDTKDTKDGQDNLNSNDQ